MCWPDVSLDIQVNVDATRMSHGAFTGNSWYPEYY